MLTQADNFLAYPRLAYPVWAGGSLSKSGLTAADKGDAYPFETGWCLSTTGLSESGLSITGLTATDKRDAYPLR